MTDGIRQEFDREDERNIWVCPDSQDLETEAEIGTCEQPFRSISAALKKAAPGRKIILMPGVYCGDQTIEICGSVKESVSITSSGEGEVIIEGGCWYFYDTSDLVVSGLIFKNAPRGAISVIGNCCRNRFHGINFIDCGISAEASCTFYFGGLGAKFNMVENCNFIRSAKVNNNAEDCAAELSAKTAIVGLMVSDGDVDNPLRNHIFRRNVFCNYDKAVILGAGGMAKFDSSHIVEYNKIENCGSDGITVKCSDVQIRGNFISGCMGAGIALAAGDYSIIESNRVSASSQGITVNGAGHTVGNNCFVRCQFTAVTACAQSKEYGAAGNLFIQENTIVDCGGADNGSAVIIEHGACGIIQKNLFYGCARAYSCQADSSSSPGELSSADKSQLIISENFASEHSHSLDGMSIGSVEFCKYSDDNFQNESGYGACGWVLSADDFHKHADEALVNTQEDYISAYQLESEEDDSDNDDGDNDVITPDEIGAGTIFEEFFTSQIPPQTLYDEC